jgi:TolB protein
MLRLIGRFLASRTLLAVLASSVTWSGWSWADPSPAGDPSEPQGSGDVLGEFIVTGTVQEHVPKIAILPSLSPALEDVIVRSVVRRDLELSGMFDVIADDKAPAGNYDFEDPVDVTAWQNLGAEAIVKVAARDADNGRIEVLGLAYFPSAGKKPVYQTKIVVDKANARKTGHQITDDLLGALTGRPGGFSSRFTFSGKWVRNRRIFSADADGYGLTPRTPQDVTAIGPTYGPDGQLYYSASKNYAPFVVNVLSADGKEKSLKLPFAGNIYSTAFDKTGGRLAVAVSKESNSHIYVGKPNGSDMKMVSTTELATHPAFSSEGHVAWVGGNESQGSTRIYVDGKPVSPNGFTASSPTFCDTEDGVFLIYSVNVGSGRHDLVMSRPNGRGLTRLTQNQGSNTYPACSPDGRLLAFFSTRNKEEGLYVLSLKRWTTKKVLGQIGEGLRWEALPRDFLTRPATDEATPAPLADRGPACGLAPAPSSAHKAGKKKPAQAP